MPSILIVTGEDSGEHYGALLVRALREVRSDLRFWGSGGQQMEEAGVELLVHVRDLSAIGPAAALKNAAHYWRGFRRLMDGVQRRKPAVAVLIDFPEFNLRLAPRLKRFGIRVVYYISPQLWAWRKNRAKIIREHIDRMAVIFPFEVDWYAQVGIPVHYVGHPIFEKPAGAPFSKHELCARLGCDPDVPLVGLMPGSRVSEIDHIFPVMLETGRLICARTPAQFLVIRAPHIPRQFLERKLSAYPDVPVAVLDGPGISLLRACDLGLIKSGTATVEAAIAGVPFLVLYRMPWWSWCYTRLLVDVPYVSLVNLVAGKEVVPEFVQADARPSLLAAEALKLWSDPSRRLAMQEELLATVDRLRCGQASAGVAQLVTHLLDHR
ncbi:MAG: lipid-A-disaccharide synthase [Acidobacteria bacterium]|nr:lipid-A-disaccharide synthase [Acidobacteriota bacterium]